jgi:acyl-CoA reductase-like NAD-dependent aldehyde dehydrogenase
VVAIAAPQDSSLLGLVSVMAPAIAAGNTVVVVSSYSRPLPAITLAEVLATSDLPGGVVNILTGDMAEIGPWLASHLDVNAIDLTGVDEQAAASLAAEASDNLKRVLALGPDDWTADPGTARMQALLEVKTVWHPIGV